LGQEFFINSQGLEDKIRQLLPTQGGAGQNFDLSANTQIIPIIDLTESAEGSNLRQDLQTSLSLNSVTSTSVINTATTIISNTGYFRVLGSVVLDGAGTCKISVTDGVTTKILFQQVGSASVKDAKQFDLSVFLEAGHSVIAESTSAVVGMQVVTRQIATILNELVDP